MIALYARSRRKPHDGWPIFLRDDCDRTPFDPQTGYDEGLFDLMLRLDRAGYDLLTRVELEAE